MTMNRSEDTLLRYRLSRRRLLGLTAGGTFTALVAAACGDDDDAGSGAPSPSATDSPPSPTMAAPDATSSASPTAQPSPGAARGTPLISDIVDHALDSEEWTGDFGFITFRLHSAYVGGEDAYFIRTDASDQAFANAEGLIHVPLMANALDAAEGLSSIYLFEDGAEGQRAVLNTAPHLPDYSPAFRLHRVSHTGEPALLDSAEAILAAEASGAVAVEVTDIVVNYPVVKWPGGELPNDQERTAYLGDGQLPEPVDVDGGLVTFKLHACYPASRYIVTDVTMPPMAEAMNIAPAPAAAGLMAAGATAKILVFGNGVEGSGPMGFQKSVTDTTVGDPLWSSYWDHYTFLWSDGAAAAVLTSEAEILDRESAGDLERFLGTPDTAGEIFMVNCPVPVVAPVA